jgi:hypothetical protein
MSETAPDAETLPPYEGIALADVRLVRTARMRSRRWPPCWPARRSASTPNRSRPSRKAKSRPGRTWCSWPTTPTPGCSRSAPRLRRRRAVRRGAAPGAGIADHPESRLRPRRRFAPPARQARHRDPQRDRPRHRPAPGERNAWGAKTAVARFFGRRLQKSRRITTTNWALPRLSEQQIQYAADDAHVALRIYRHWRAAFPAAAETAAANAARLAARAAAQARADAEAAGRKTGLNCPASRAAL